MSNIMRYAQQSLSRRPSAQEAQEFIGIDGEFRKNMSAIRDGAHKIEDANKAIRLALEPGQSQITHGLARLFQTIVPDSLHRFLPEGMTRFVDENTNGLAMIAAALRMNLNNIQNAVSKNIAICMQKKKDFDTLEAVITKIEGENWAIQEIQAYLAQRVGIAVQPEIMQISNIEVDLLSEEKREALRQSMLSHLKEDVVENQGMNKVSKELCSGMVMAFNISLLGLHSYEQRYRHYAIIAESAKDMSKLSNAMFVSRAALGHTLDVSVEVIEDTFDAFESIARSGASSRETRLQLEQARARISAKVDQLQTTLIGQDGIVIKGEVVRNQLTAPRAEKLPN